MMAAEERNITKDEAESIDTTDLFGEEYSDMFIDAVRQGGNYGEFYDLHYHSLLPRKDYLWNKLNNGTTGLIRVLDWPEYAGQGLQLGSTIMEILDRSQLRCAVRDGQSVTNLIDTEFCHAVAAALFGNNESALSLVNVRSQSDGFALLADRDVDVMAGATWTIQSDVRENSTGQGYSFTQPYFYQPVGNNR